MAIQRSGRFDRVKKPLKSDMNVVPYIDVMLVLLVIFMITAPMITTGVKVDLPQASNQPMQLQERPAIVTLTADGKISLCDKTHDNVEMSLEQLTEILTENQQQAEANKKTYNVLINGSETRPYGEVMQLMSALQQAGLSEVGLLTESVNQ